MSINFEYKNSNAHDTAVTNEIFKLLCKEQSVFLFGQPGSGKTFAAQALSGCLWDTTSCQFLALDNSQVCDWITDAECFDIYMRYKALILDDIGCEKETNEYGIKSNPVDIFINRYYQRMMIGNYCPILVATSNLTPEELLAKYGARLFSRMKGIFSFARFTGTDKRKLKIIGG